MKSRPAYLLLLVLLGAGAAPAQAETAYVTDRLLLGLYAEASSSSQQYRTLPSGTRLEILERQGLYARIVTEDGLEGWVKVNFLVSDPPAVVRIRSLEEQVAESGSANQPDSAELNELRAQNLALNERILQLEGQLAMAQQALTDQIESAAGPVQADPAQAQPDSAEGEPADQPAEDSGEPPAPDSDRLSTMERWLESNPWLIGGLILGTVPGFLLGANWMSRRVRRRFSGLRVW